MKIGSKEWWLNHIAHRNRTFGHQMLEIVNESPDEQFLYVSRKGSAHYPMQGDHKDERYLKECFRGIGLFDMRTTPREEVVKLGNYKGKIDLLAQGFDGSRWVIECKIVEKKHKVGDRKTPISIGQMAESLGQSVLYTVLFEKKYPSQQRKVMSAICVWTLGSGSSHVIELCKRLRVTMLQLDRPAYMPHGQALRIYYLD